MAKSGELIKSHKQKLFSIRNKRGYRTRSSIDPVMDFTPMGGGARGAQDRSNASVLTFNNIILAAVLERQEGTEDGAMITFKRLSQ